MFLVADTVMSFCGGVSMVVSFQSKSLWTVGKIIWTYLAEVGKLAYLALGRALSP